jgi:hypothetical protein
VVSVLREPALTDVELIALRQLIEERFGLPSSFAAIPRSVAAEEDGRVPVETPSAGAGPLNVNWQLLSSAQRAITHWIGGASCTNTTHWRSVADALETAANQFRDLQTPLHP